MSALLVTVVGPSSRQDLSLPADAAVAELLPKLVGLVGEGDDEGAGDSGAWVLLGPAGEPLDAAATLGDNRVLDGAVLRLTRVRPQPSESPRPPLPAPAGDELSPTQRTAALLPPRLGSLRRLGLAAKAFVRKDGYRPPEPVTLRPPSPVLSDEFLGPTPAELTTATPASPLERARQVWRSTPYPSQLDRVIRAPRLRGCVTIAVVSPKGGVGKTTITALLGTLLAVLRRDRIVAVDTNPDYGSLGRVLAPDHRLFVDDFLARVEDPGLTAAALDTQLGRGPHGLMVLPAPTDPGRMWKLDEHAYTAVIERLQELVNVVLLDCGTGLQEPAAGTAIRSSHQLILVTDAEPAGASLVAEAGRLLLRAGRPITLVVNKMPRKGSRLDLDAFARSLPESSGLVVIPADVDAAQALSAGRFSWEHAPDEWRIAVRELAVALMAEWPALGLTL